MLLCALDADIFNQVYGKGELKYKPFILRVKRSNVNARLLELKVFEN